MESTSHRFPEDTNDNSTQSNESRFDVLQNNDNNDMCIESMDSTDRPASSSSSSSQNFTKAKSSSWIPSDITWPDPTNPDTGTFPSDDFRNQRFKLYPMIVDGPWVVKTAVRACPCLLGQKVVQRYFRGDHYFEIDVHVASSIIAKQIVENCEDHC